MISTLRAPLVGASGSALRAHIGGLCAEFERIGLDLTIERDFDGLVEVRAGSDSPWIYPTFDPKHSDLSDAQWLRVSTPQGDTVATYAIRAFDTENFFDLMRSGALWFERPSEDASRCPVEETLEISGIVGHAGGAWVDRDWRGHGLAQLLCQLGRALLLRDHDIEHETGLVFEKLYRSGLASRAYGYPRVVEVVNGYFPPTGKPERVYLGHVARDEMWEAITRPAEVAPVDVLPFAAAQAESLRPAA